MKNIPNRSELAKQVAAEEKLRALRREEILSVIVMGLFLFGGIFFLAFTSDIFTTVVCFVIFGFSIFITRQATRKRQELLKKLEKGEFDSNS